MIPSPRHAGPRAGPLAAALVGLAVATGSLADLGVARAEPLPVEIARSLYVERVEIAALSPDHAMLETELLETLHRELPFCTTGTTPAVLELKITDVDERRSVVAFFLRSETTVRALATLTSQRDPSRRGSYVLEVMAGSGERPGPARDARSAADLARALVWNLCTALFGPGSATPGPPAPIDGRER